MQYLFSLNFYKAKCKIRSFFLELAQTIMEKNVGTLWASLCKSVPPLPQYNVEQSHVVSRSVRLSNIEWWGVGKSGVTDESPLQFHERLVLLAFLLLVRHAFKDFVMGVPTIFFHDCLSQFLKKWSNFTFCLVKI